MGSILIDNDQANASISDTDKRAQGTTKTFGEMIGKAAKVGAGIALAMGGAAIAVGGLAVSFSDDLQKSLNGVQSATGVADEQMIGMKDTMLAIYNNNFGADFEDIGASMTTVSQQTGLAGEALQAMTEDALALRDTFGMEVADSVKGANQLMKQFGMDGTEAYNLIAQGAQWGLDANGDLIDTLNEYSGTFAAQGFSAEEMFNMLSNGAASGVRDVDLLADAVKEFGIRSKDGSKATTQAFKDLGLNSDALTKSFGKGGEEGKKAFEEVTTKLIGMKDPVKQNELGVALFGTQFEDLGIKGVTALVNTKGEIDKNVDALGKINDVKYNTFGEAMQGIKRNLQTGILLPLGQDILPMLQTFQTWIIANMPAIKNEISYAMKVVLDTFKAFYDWIQPHIPAIKETIRIAFDLIKTSITEGIKIVSDIIDWFVKYKAIIVPIVTVVSAVIVNAWLVTGLAAIKATIINGIAAAKVIGDWLLMGLKSTWHALKVVAAWVATAAGAVASVIVHAAQAAIFVAKWAWMGIQSLLHAGKMALAWVIAAGPIAWAIGLMIAAGVLLWQNWDTVKMKLSQAMHDIKESIRDAMNKGIDFVNGLIRAINKIPGVNAPLVSRIRVESSSVHSGGGRLPENAKGTDNWRGGLTRVNELGGEIMNLPSGTQIIPHDVSMEMAKKSQGNKATSKQPIALQLVLQNGKAIAEYLIPDLDNLMGSKNKVVGRSVGV